MSNEETANDIATARRQSTSESMRAVLLRRSARDADDPLPLESAVAARPTIGDDDVLIRVSACAVCRTDLDVAEGRVSASHYPVIPGHQAVGEIAAVGAHVRDRREGDRVGIAWIRWACGECRWCVSGRENLCPRFQSNGCDGDGGYAEYVSAPAAFTIPIPAALDDYARGAAAVRRRHRMAVAPPADIDRRRAARPDGLRRFGASRLPMARHRYPNSPIYVFARSDEERTFARELGAEWAGDRRQPPSGSRPSSTRRPPGSRSSRRSPS